MYVTASVNTYNPALTAWEPLLEPWRLLLHLDHNPHSKLCSGVDPGMSLRLTSTDGAVKACLSHAAITSMLANMPEWSMALEGGEQGELRCREGVWVGEAGGNARGGSGGGRGRGLGWQGSRGGRN